MDAKHLITGKDNETLCMGRVSWAASYVAIIAAASGIILSGGALGIAELGIALATIAAGHGAAIKLKETTEPTEVVDNEE
jgi:hypothetical protein